MTTTTPTTTFIQDFHTWRKGQITTNYSSSSTVDVTTLTAEKFIALTTFKDVTDSTTNTTEKKDIVKYEADSYVINLILYHLSDTGLKVLDTTKPTLTNEILNTFQNDTTYVADLKKYANLWLLQSIQQQSIESKRTNYVRSSAVEADFKTVQTGKPMTNINMRLTFIATAKKTPEFLPYMYNSDTMIDKVQTYLLEENYRKTWVENTFNALKDKMDDSSLNDNVRFMELKAKLDILDPSFNLSCTVLNEYYSYLYVLTAPFSMKKSPKVHKIFKKVTTSTLKKIIAKTDHPWYDTVVQAKNLFKGNVASLSGQISRAIFAIRWGDDITINTIDPKHVMTFDSGRFVGKIEKKFKGRAGGITNAPELAALWRTENMHRVASAIYILCNAATLYAAFMSYDKMTDLEKVLTWVNTVVSGVDAVTSVIEAVNATYSVYTWIGKRIAPLLKPKTGPLTRATAITNESKYAKYFKISWVMKYITAALILVSMAFTVYDMVTAIQNQDWGLLTLSVVEFALEFGVLVLTFMTATSWSGPVCLILTGILVVIGVIKIFWEQIKEFFHNIFKSISTLFTADPAVIYIKAADSKYRIEDAEINADLLIQLDDFEKLHPEYKFKLDTIRSILLGEGF